MKPNSPLKLTAVSARRVRGYNIESGRQQVSPKGEVAPCLEATHEQARNHDESKSPLDVGARGLNRERRLRSNPTASAGNWHQRPTVRPYPKTPGRGPFNGLHSTRFRAPEPRKVQPLPDPAPMDRLVPRPRLRIRGFHDAGHPRPLAARPPQDKPDWKMHRHSPAKIHVSGKKRPAPDGSKSDRGRVKQRPGEILTCRSIPGVFYVSVRIGFLSQAS